MSENRLTPLQVWLLASRPKTLPAAAAPVIVGTSLAFFDEGFRIGPALACLLAALLLQIGSNFANDVFDYEKGADHGDRTGPMRVTQAGLLTSGQVKHGMILVFAIAALLGLYLTFVGGWPILIVGVAAIISAIAYTGGPYPLGYHGLGDLFVFIFFGLAAVAGTYYVQVLKVTSTVWWIAVSMGLMTVAILVVNNLRDIESDRRVGKHTLAVQFGDSAARLEYVFCLLGAYIIPVVLWRMGMLPFLSLFVFLTIPAAMKLIREMYHNVGQALNKTLAGTGQLELFYALCFASGLLINALFD